MGLLKLTDYMFQIHVGLHVYYAVRWDGIVKACMQSILKRGGGGYNDKKPICNTIYYVILHKDEMYMYVFRHSEIWGRIISL